MKEMLKKKLDEKKKNNKGFTLIEILVVLVIMGFLVAMVAPKLAGVSDRAIDVADDNSQKELQKAMQYWINEENSIPRALANMDITINPNPVPPFLAGEFIMASIDDNNSSNGAEVISKDFADKWLPMPHYMNAAEVTELKGMIGNATAHYGLVAALTDGDGNLVQDAGTQGDIIERYMRKPVAPNQCVMMIGAGFDASGAAGVDVYALAPLVTLNGSTISPIDTAVTTPLNLAAGVPQLATSSNYLAGPMTYGRIVEGPLMLRIVMGMTDRNQLINTGMLDKAGISPKATQSSNYEFGNYYVVLPRMQATVDRFQANAAGNLVVNGAGLADDNVVQHSIGFNEEEDGTFTLVARTPHSPGNMSGRALLDQPLTHTVILSPEGDKWAADRADWFGSGLALGHGNVGL